VTFNALDAGDPRKTYTDPVADSEDSNMPACTVLIESQSVTNEHTHSHSHSYVKTSA